MSDNWNRYWDAMNAGIVPEWAYQMDVHASKIYHADPDDPCDEFTLPSVAQQWKQDMSRKVRNVRRTNPGAYPVLRASDEFIKTGKVND